LSVVMATWESSSPPEHRRKRC